MQAKNLETQAGARGEELQEKYGLHEAHRTLLPPGERNARSIKARGSAGMGVRAPWSCRLDGFLLGACWALSGAVVALEPGELPAFLPDAGPALRVC